MAHPTARRCSRCGCQLSQYNSDGVCAACVRVRAEHLGDRPRVVPGHVWSDPDIHEALACRDFGRANRLIRQRGALRQWDVAQLTGLSQAFLSMLESGNRRLTNIDKITQYLTGLDIPGDLVPIAFSRRTRGTFQSQPSLSAGDLDPSLPWTASRMSRALHFVSEGDKPSASGSEVVAYAHQWRTAEGEPLARATRGSRLSDSFLDGLQSTANNLRVMDAHSGSGTLANIGRANLAFLNQLSRNASYNQRTGRRLAAVIADTAIQTGWFTFDSGDLDGAPPFLLAALRASEASGDVRLGAGALSYLAVHAYSCGSPRNATTAARVAREKTKHIGAPALEAMLLTRQARGHAKLGERKEAMAALGRAAELAAGKRTEQDPHWLYWVNQGEILGQAGSSYLDLGEPHRALTAFTDAASALDPSHERTLGLYLSRAASAAVRKGDFDAGCARASEALDLAARVQSVRLREHIHRMLRDFENARGSRAAEDILGRGASVMRTADEHKQLHE